MLRTYFDLSESVSDQKIYPMSSTSPQNVVLPYPTDHIVVTTARTAQYASSATIVGACHMLGEVRISFVAGEKVSLVADCDNGRGRFYGKVLLTT